jgi:hypothetical protein
VPAVGVENVADLAGAIRGKTAVSGAMRTGRIRENVRRVFREPLLHFFVLGLLLFLAGEWHRQATDPYRVVIGPDRIAKIAQDYRMQYGVPPTAVQLKTLVDRYADDEVLFREGEALKLGDGDEIVRRRVIQKMQFLVENLREPGEPSDAQLLAFYNANKARYVTEDRRSFTHIYFSPDQGGETAARARAMTVLASLKPGAGRAPERGDTFPDLYDYSGFATDEATRLFGHSEFADALFKAPVGKWSGPYRSGYGYHLLLVQSDTPPSLPPFASIKDRVRSDYLDAVQKQQDDANFAKLKSKYTFVFPKVLP